MSSQFWADLSRRMKDPKFRSGFVEVWSKFNGERPVYEVTVTPWRRGVELHVGGVGMTQVRWRRRAEKTVRDLIAQRQGVEAGSFDLTWTYRE